MSGADGYYSSSEWSFVRPFCLGCNPGQMTPLAGFPIDQGRVLRESIIPYHDRPKRPFDSGMEVGAVGDVFVEELEDRIRLFLLEPYNIPSD